MSQSSANCKQLSADSVRLLGWCFFCYEHIFHVSCSSNHFGQKIRKNFPTVIILLSHNLTKKSSKAKLLMIPSGSRFWVHMDSSTTFRTEINQIQRSFSNCKAVTQHKHFEYQIFWYLGNRNTKFSICSYECRYGLVFVRQGQ